MLLRLLTALSVLLIAVASPVAAQVASVSPAQVAPPPSIFSIPAKKLFGSFKQPTLGPSRAIGFYSKGCMSGAAELPLTDPSPNPAWQVMRTSRNRNWANPAMVSLIKKLARDAKQYDGWNGLLVGDMAQPRGGPMASGHASHQVGLDADVWLTPMPNRILSTAERETFPPIEMVKDRKTIDSGAFDDAHARLIKRAASYPQVTVIFVHPPIKAALCKWATGDRSWLAKVHPYFNHTYHMHIRIGCPADSPDCKPQYLHKPKDGTGCGEELAWWMGDVPWAKPKPRPGPPPKPAPPLTLAGLPAECRAVAQGH